MKWQMLKNTNRKPCAEIFASASAHKAAPMPQPLLPAVLSLAPRTRPSKFAHSTHGGPTRAVLETQCWRPFADCTQLVHGTGRLKSPHTTVPIYDVRELIERRTSRISANPRSE